MKNKSLTLIGIILIVLSAILSYFTDIPVMMYTAVIGGAVGLALLITTAWDKSEKKSWKEILCLILIPVGAMLLVFAGISEEKITALFESIIGIVCLIAGLLAKKFIE